MSLEAFGIWSEIVASIAVVISLVYLAIQVRDGSNQSQAAMTSNIMNEMNRLYEVMLSNPQIPELLGKLGTASELTDTENALLDSVARRYLVFWWEVQAASDRGLLNPLTYETFCEDARRVCRQYPKMAKHMQTVMDDYKLGKHLTILAPIYE